MGVSLINSLTRYAAGSTRIAEGVSIEPVQEAATNAGGKV